MNKLRAWRLFSAMLVLALLWQLVAPLPASAAEPPPQFSLTWGEGGNAEGQFDTPAGIAVDAAGNVYVADSYNNRIQKFDSSGKFLLAWGSYGEEESQFDEPRGIAVDAAGNVYVADAYNNRIQKFNSSGNFLLAWGSYGEENGQFDTPAGIAVDAAGNVYAADK